MMWRIDSARNGLVSGGPHGQPVTRADAAYVLEQLDIASAHQLNDALVTALAQTADDVDSRRTSSARHRER
jgi:hypothetical protein